MPKLRPGAGAGQGTVMKTIYLLRHAKSSWSDPELADVDRPLAGRGISAAVMMGEHLVRAGARPGLILCSPALRTRQTAQLAGLEDPLYDETLYQANGMGLLARLKDLPAALASVMLIGHNPGLRSLALLLAQARPGGWAWDRLVGKLPTGALVTLVSDTGRWEELALGSCSLEGFVRPKDLVGSHSG